MFSFHRCFYKSALFINTTKYPPEWKNASFLEEDILQEIFSISLMPPNSAIKCLGNTPGECSYTVLNVGFWKIHPFPMNNQLALKLKIQVTLKDSSFLGLQPSYLVYEIFYKPLYEFNSILLYLTPNFNLDVLYLKIYTVWPGHWAVNRFIMALSDTL